MTRVHAAVLRAAHYLEHVYRYLTPRARRSQRATYLRETVQLKRSFTG